MRIINYLSKYYKGYLAGFLFLIITNLLAAYIPQLIKQAVDLLSGFSLLLETKLDRLILLIAGLAIVMAFARAMSRQIVFAIGRQVEFDLKKTIFDHLICLEPKFFSEKRTGDLISIITNDVQSLRALGGFAMLNIANTIIAFTLILPLMFDLHRTLTWAFLGTIPLVIIFIISLSGAIKKYQEAVQVALGQLSNFIEQNLSAIHIVKLYAQENPEISRFVEQNQELKNFYIKLVGVRSLIGPVMRVIASLGFILLLYIGGKAVIDQQFTTGDFAAYALYIQRLIWPVATLGWLITIIYRAQVSQKRINSILGREPAIQDSQNAIDKKTFDSDLQILDYKITKGQTVAVIGAIGSGKSTLANKLMHLVELETGEILLDGVDIKKIKLDSLRSLVNLVPQENFLFSTSIRENIAYAKDLNQEQIEELAKLVGIHDEIMNFKDGYETIVGERGVTLSGGQRQRIAMARALALDSEILVLDDALSNLDSSTAKKVLAEIKKLRQGKTTIFITHKLDIIKDLDQVLVMEGGRIIEK